MDIQKITGTLTLRPVRAELVQDPRTMTVSLGPYCLMFVGSHRLKTENSNGPLLEPYWDDSFIINITNEAILQVKVCSTGLAFKTQNLLGQGSLDIESLKKDSEVQSRWINLYSRKELVGKLLLETRYIEAPKGRPVISCQHPEFDEVIKKKVQSLVLDDLPEEPQEKFVLKTAIHSTMSMDLY
mmetsp:Transcript_4495/g.4961  ORF Transcript_4495/g.4961 Transcript_4495/m.4961 type:complete len:184 (+) Transcript_4495:80-631(+)